MDLNEKALLQSLDDERRRWAAECQGLQAELLTARRLGLPTSGSAFQSTSTGQTPPGDRVQTVVVVEPSQRLPSSPLGSVDAGPNKFDGRFSGTGNSEMMTSSDGKLGSGSICSHDFETARQSSRAEIHHVGCDDDAEKLRVQLALCRRELSDERRRWADEKRVVVEYQLRLQTYCRQLTDRNRRLEDQLRAMSLELGRNGGSSGYSSDSAALVAQFLDDSSLLTSSL